MSNDRQRIRRVRKKNTGTEFQKQTSENKGEKINKKRHLYVWAALIGILLLSFFLNTAALGWGQMGDASWSPDSIEGIRTVVHLPNLFKMWRHKYPRGQYLVSFIFYKPKIEQWKKDPVTVKLPDGKTARTPIDQKRLYKLATISRRITVFMSLGIIVAVFLTARKLFDDGLTGILSGLCLVLSCHFMFYSQSACLDVPAFFWFAWAGCCGLYAIKSNNLFLYLLAGFCASWSVCTKEAVATFHIGLAVALAVLLIHTKVSAGQPFGKALLSLLNWKILAAIVVAVLVFVTLEGMWGGLDEWHHRSQFWKEAVKKDFKSREYTIVMLLKQTYRGLFSGWGVPFLVLLVVSLVYWIVRYRWQLCLAVLPFLSFFFLTVLVVERNYPRYMICGYAGIVILMGKALADWYRFKRVPLIPRHILPLLVLVPSFICCVCFNLEMRNDTRVRAEQWMRTFAKSQAIVGLSMHKGYAPRIWLDGFRSIMQWNSKGIVTRQGKVQIWPDYVIGSNQWPCLSEEDKEFFKKIFKGETVYQEQAKFDRLYFNQGKYIWKYCLRFFELHRGISPRIMIYKKEDGQV